jgi:serine/threonine-protein kinase
MEQAPSQVTGDENGEPGHTPWQVLPRPETRGFIEFSLSVRGTHSSTRSRSRSLAGWCSTSRQLAEDAFQVYYWPVLIAQQLGRYHLLDRIAFGGMAEIFRAKTYDSRGQEHMVAIKRVLRHLSDDDDFLQMLVDEAKIVSLLDHANIARVYEFVRVGEDYFIAMEYVDGKDLRSILDRCRAEGLWLTIEDCAYVIMRVAEGLHAAHEKCDGTGIPLNIVHRDVSPSNVLISYQGQVKLCDFGIAKATLSRIQTRTGVIKGKVKYMSPEQAMGRPVDRRSDLFSAGTVLYETLTKQCPFQADNEMELIFRVRDAKYPRPTRYNPEIPPALDRVLRKAMARAVSSRYQSALELAGDLREFLHRVAPDYAPGRLGRTLRGIFAEDIDKDLRQLEQYVLGSADPSAVGDNLLAEVLGEGAAYTQFTPVNPVPSDLPPEKTRMMPRVPSPESRLPFGVDLHNMKTHILDPEERNGRTIKRRRRKRPGADFYQEMRQETQRGTAAVPVDGQVKPAGRASPEADLHDQKTQILDSDEE